jgi:glyceraldehyde-3-phosphate dehydrogenase (NAD(P))
MIKVGINGYGTIGRRVAEAVGLQDDMELVGVTKTRPDYRATMAIEKGIPVYAANSDHAAAFDKAKVPYAGTLSDLLKQVDIIIDATPELGEEYKPVYEQAGVKAIFQGGEEHSLTGSSFNAQCNYASVKGLRMTRVVSCNTTALCRTLHALDKRFGIARARVVLIRRAADPDEISKGPIDAIVPDPITLPSHHGPDVQTVLTGLNITTMAVKVPATHMHLHTLMITLNRSPTKEEVVQALYDEPRILLVDGKAGFKSTAQVIDWGREKGRPRNDVYEAAVWRDSVATLQDEVFMFLGVHQEAIVIPENIDAIRALLTDVPAAESIAITDRSMGITHRF